MPNKKIIEIAEAIIEDWKGSGYLKDPHILTNFLKEQFTSTENSEVINEVANLIVDDLNSAGYYKDPKVLSDFLEGKFRLK